MRGIIINGFGDELKIFDEMLQDMLHVMQNNIDNRYKRSMGYFLYELADKDDFSDFKNDERFKKILNRRIKAQGEPGMAGKPNQPIDLDKFAASLQQAYDYLMEKYKDIIDIYKETYYKALEWQVESQDAKLYFRHRLRELAGNLVAEAGGE